MKTKAFIAFSLTMFFAFCFGLAVGKIFSKHKQTNIIDNVSEATLTEWEALQLAIIMTESNFDSLAVGKNGDLGLYQITEVYVEEVNRILGEDVYEHTDAFNPAKARAMFDVYQSYYNPSKDINKAICLHNPNGNCIGYSVKVLKNLERIKMYETIRQGITEELNNQ